eukprot:scaffold283988_cov30-Tisochrysis_lutea.AAC.1
MPCCCSVTLSSQPPLAAISSGALKSGAHTRTLRLARHWLKAPVPMTQLAHNLHAQHCTLPHHSSLRHFPRLHVGLAPRPARLATGEGENAAVRPARAGRADHVEAVANSGKVSRCTSVNSGKAGACCKAHGHHGNSVRVTVCFHEAGLDSAGKRTRSCQR